ncbi:MAG TPA: tetratricopeptide repeat protein [Pirellulales bacterium]|nr:tetratricopeptide repeat protein [Pirellulales bacterium]
MRSRSLGKWAALGCLLGAVVFAAIAAWRRLEFNQALDGARESMRTGDLPHAVEVLNQLEKDRPRSAEVAYLLGICHRRLATTSKARSYFQQAGELGWPRKELMRQEAMCDFQGGEKASESFLLESVKAGCDDETASEIYECLVKGYLGGLYLREASLCLEYWLEWRPQSVQAHELKAELLHAVGDTTEEVAEYRTLVRLDPNNRDARMKLGHVLLDNRAAAEALEQFRYCRDLDPDDPGIGFAIAACQRSLGNLEEAERDLRASLSGGGLSAAQRAFALVELGHVAIARRSYEEAVDCFREALVDSPADRTAHYALGRALARLGQTDEANAHVDESVKIDNQNEQLGDLLHEIIRAPDDPEPRCKAGEILLAQVNHREAYLWLLSALRCDKTHKRTHEALARYYAATGKQDAAERHLAWAANGGAAIERN